MPDTDTRTMPPEIEAAVRKLAKASPGGTANATIVGSITEDNKHFFSSTDVYKSGIRLRRKDNSHKIEISAKAIQAAADDADKEITDARVLGESADPFNYSTDSIIEPPWDFNILTSLLVDSTWHASCIEVKASDYAYNEPKLFLRPGAEKIATEDELARAKQEIFAFLASCNDGKAIEDLLRDVAVEYESLGCAAFEIRRDKRGFIGALTHVPFGDVRVLQSSFADETGAKYMQRKFGKRVYYIGMNDNVKYTDRDGNPFNPTHAQDAEFPSLDARIDHVEYTSPFVSYHSADETTNLDNSANELFVLTRSPYTRSRIYGTPAGISAYPAILAQMKIDAYNLSFFSAQGVPQYAVIFEGLSSPSGGSTDDVLDGEDVMTPDSTAQLRETVRQYFKKELSSGNRSILVLTMTGDAKVTFQKLSSDELEASFEQYETRCRDKVRVAHHVPSTALGIDITNTGIGGNREQAQMRRYRDHVVIPGQRMLENIVNIIIRCGLLIPYYDFKFAPMNLEDEAARREFALKEFVAGGATLNEYRELTGKPRIATGDVFILRSTNLTMIEVDSALTGDKIQQSIGYEKRLRAMLGDDRTTKRLSDLSDTIALLEEDE